MAQLEERISQHWLALVNAVFALISIVPWLPPVFMRLGAIWPARVLYFFYGFLCHQLATRSFFLFGSKLTYSYEELLGVAPELATRALLRDLIGDPALGYKVAWSDRMVSMFAGLFLVGLIFGLLRRKARPLGWKPFGLLLAPMVLDGASHMISDLAGLGQGFRHANAWLAWLSANVLPPSFYVGDGLGSFNSWMRLLSGLLFGLAVVWAVYPRIERSREATAPTNVKQHLEGFRKPDDGRGHAEAAQP
jgi:uncharacterized membrane protein